MTNGAITVKGLGVRKQKKNLLKNVSFTVKPGIICGLLGPSGAGKTTLMRTLVGIQIPSEGQVSVFDKQAGDQDNRPRIGYVTQASSIYNDLTVYQNLHYFAQLVGADKTAIKKAIKSVHLEPKKNQLVSTLSGGESTRVSLAIALLGDPDLLVLDEPTVGLDPLLRQDLWVLFNAMADKGKTLIVSSHVMDEALHCSQLLLLREGKLFWNDSSEKLLRKTHEKSIESAFIHLMKSEET